jgi:hypothetical protein
MSTITVDTARLPLLLYELRLPAVSRLWQDIAARADNEGWPAIRFLSALAELELAERARRRVERHLAESRMPPGKTLDTFDFNAVPMLSKAHVMALASGDTWLAKGANLLLFGPPGSGKSDVAAALGRALVENGYRVLFMRTTDIVQRPLALPLQAPAPEAREGRAYRGLGSRHHRPQDAAQAARSGGGSARSVHAAPRQRRPQAEAQRAASASSSTPIRHRHRARAWQANTSMCPRCRGRAPPRGRSSGRR